MKNSIPNILTASNLFCGSIAVIFIFLGKADMVAWFILAALFMDFMDGFVARMLKVSSPVGKELDSLADMVSFGLVPALIMSRMLAEQAGHSFPTMDLSLGEMGFLAGLLIAIFSAFRLAKFNLDERQSDAFYGLPTPANTILILSLWLIAEYWPDNWLNAFLGNIYVLLAITAFSCYILIADVRLIALKFKNFQLKDNLSRFLLLGISLVLLIALQVPGIPLIIFIYLLLSILENTGILASK
ncbi:MAG: CDP-alcohol phosphatidyltransferase family protein [Bacteroidia bacterium]|nr:CDP-alcohol phosphatidyltransferase family protein [Bacteroidia bacterium]